MIRLFAPALLAWLSAGFAGAAETRIAVLAPPEWEDAAAVLTASLSALPGVEVIERERLAAIVREKNLPTDLPGGDHLRGVARLAGARFLAVLEPSPAGASFVLRWIAVDPGLVLAQEQVAWPMEDPSGWATLQARRWARRLASLPEKPNTVSLVAVVGVRSATAGIASDRLSRQAAVVLNGALAKIPGVHVLGRDLMRETEWEKQLSDTAAGPYWAGAWALDGTVQRSGGDVAFEGRLQSLASGGSVDVHARALDLDALGASVAECVAKAIKASPPVPEGALAEAELFQDQAKWSFRWKRYSEAERAADTSWWLGNRTESVALLRFLAPAREVEIDLSEARRDFPRNAPFAVQVDRLRRAVATLGETLPPEGTVVSREFLAGATEVISIASRFLKICYFQRVQRSEEDVASLSWLRDNLRSLAPDLAGRCLRAWESLDPNKQAAGRQASEWPARFFADSLLYAPLWADTPEQSAGAFEKVLAETDALPLPLGRDVLGTAIFDRRNFPPILPVVVAWNPADRTRVSNVRRQLLERLVSGPPMHRVVACYLGLLRYDHFTDRALADQVPDQTLRLAFEDTFRILNAMVAEIASGQVDEGSLGALVGLANALTDLYQRDDLSALAQGLKKNLLLRLLEAGYAGRPDFYNPLLRSLVFTTAERERFVTAVRRVSWPPSRRANARHFEETILKQTGVDPLYVPVPPEPGISPDALRPAFRFQVATRAGENQVEAVRLVGDKYLAEIRRHPDVFTVLELDPESGRQKTVFEWSAVPDPALRAALKVCRDWAADDRFVFFVGNRFVHRFDRSSREVVSREVSLLSGDRAVVRIVLGRVYIAQSDALIQVDSGSLDSELIASARRRPARTILDDRPDLRLIPVEENGALVLIGEGDRKFRWSPEQKDFVAEPFALRPRSRTAYDRAFLLAIQPQMAGGFVDASGDPGYWILLDPHRTGKTPKITGLWPPPLRLAGGEQFPSQILSMSAGGETLYVFFAGGPTRSLHLLACTNNGNFCAPLGPEMAGRVRVHNRVTGSAGGALVWGREASDLYFYRLADLERFPRP